MSTVRLRDAEGYKDFKEDETISFFRCEDEYPGWTGEEKYIIITDISEKELLSRFSHVMEAMRPYMIINSKYGEIYSESKSIERSINRFITVHQTTYDFDEDTEYCNEELIDNHFIDLIDSKIDLAMAISFLTIEQKNRIFNHYYNGFTFKEIGKFEGIKPQSIYDSIELAEIKMKKYLSAN